MVIRYPLHCTTCPCSTVTASLDVSKTCKQDTDSPMMRNLTALSRYSHACIHSLLLLQVVLVIDSTAKVVRSKNLKSRFWHAITVSKRDCQRGLWVFVSSKNAVHLWVHLYTRCSVPILDAVSPTLCKLLISASHEWWVWALFHEKNLFVPHSNILLQISRNWYLRSRSTNPSLLSPKVLRSGNTSTKRIWEQDSINVRLSMQLREMRGGCK